MGLKLAFGDLEWDQRLRLRGRGHWAVSEAVIKEPPGNLGSESPPSLGNDSATDRHPAEGPWKEMWRRGSPRGRSATAAGTGRRRPGA